MFCGCDVLDEGDLFFVNCNGLVVVGVDEFDLVVGVSEVSLFLFYFD